jgi:hypothetical protein
MLLLETKPLQVEEPVGALILVAESICEVNLKFPFIDRKYFRVNMNTTFTIKNQDYSQTVVALSN